ncbi:MAG TPA: AI-2E family transporter, partial [Pseudobdellovibrionaceae bacterium]|nr:AI-2E family transporter [Pseudobdellovibrionaceae bacterium]
MLIFFIAFILVYFSFPIVKKLEIKGVRREISTLVLFSMLSILSLVFVFVVVPVLYRNIYEFIVVFPNYLNTALPQLIEKVKSVLHSLGMKVEISPELLSMQLNLWIRDQITHLSGGQIQDISFWVGKFLTNFLSLVLGLLQLFLVPVFYFFVLLDYEKIISFLSSLVPPRFRQYTGCYLGKVNSIFSGFLYGQSTVIFILSLLYGAGFFLVGVEYGFLIGAVTGFLCIIPYVGASLGFSVALIMNLSQGAALSQYILLTGVFVLVQTLEGFVITPRIVGNKVGLKP